MPPTPACSLMTFLALFLAAPAAAQEKLGDDPTKVTTKIGVKYNDEVSVSGSLAFGPVTKINARVSPSGDFSVGGSYLFRIGIINFAAGRSTYDDGVTQTNYALGTFVPLNALGLKSGKWLVFGTAGYNDSESNVTYFDEEVGDFLTVPLSNNSGYLGLFALRPISQTLTLQAGGIVIRGTDDYHGLAIGGGLTSDLSEKNSVTLSASHIDNSYTSDDRVGISLRHEF